MASRNGRTGRRPGGADTREQILIAARREFAARGFHGATTRSIARSADVNVALLAHYFGSKYQLFIATTDLPAAVRGQLAEVLTGELSGAGERLTRGYLALWEERATREQFLASFRSVMTDAEAMTQLRQMILGMHQQDGPGVHPERRLGLALAMSHLVGIVIARHVSELTPIADMPFEKLVARVAPAVQLHLDTG